jgi:hypothetical protein
MPTSEADMPTSKDRVSKTNSMKTVLVVEDTEASSWRRCVARVTVRSGRETDAKPSMY